MERTKPGTVTLRRDAGQLFPAVCVKVHTYATREDFDSVRAELGGPEDFTLEWAERFDKEHPETYAQGYSDVCSDGFEHAEEHAREVFAQWADAERIKVYSSGRSSGWLIVQGLPDTDAWTEEYPGLREAWDKFAEQCAEYVKGIPRAFVWDLCANIAIPAAEDAARELAERTREEDTRRAVFQALREMRASVEYLAPEEFDDDAHEKNFLAQLALASEALELAAKQWPEQCSIVVQPNTVEGA